MTPRERLFAALDGRPTDHVPVWLLFPYHATSYYVDVRTHPAYRPVFEASKNLACMLNRRDIGVPRHTSEVTLTREEAGGVTRETLVYGNTRLIHERGNGHTRKMLETDEDLEAWCSLPVNTDEKDIRARLNAQLPQYLKERDEFPSEYGAMMLALGEPINALYHAANLESYSVWSLTHDELVRRFLEQAMIQKRIIYRWCLEQNLAETYFLVGSELASPPLVSRATFQRWIVPYAQELIGMIQSYGRYAIQHYHGQIREILDNFVTMAPNGLHTIEAPPVGNCTWDQAYQAVGDRITLIGNVQYDDFRSLTPDQMRKEVRRVLDDCRGRRLILSPSAGPFDANPSPRIIENYLAFMEAARAYR